MSSAVSKVPRDPAAARPDAAAVNRAIDQRFVELIQGGDLDIPPYPAVATQLRRLLSSEDFSLSDVTRIVSSDQVLAAAILRRANSAGMAGAVATTSLDMAVARLGARGITNLALGIGLRDAVSRNGELRNMRRMVWRQALLGAELASLLAERRGLDREEAFTCGLLHDFGKVVAIACLETILRGTGRNTALSYARCVEVVDRYHVELGLVVAATWELPDIVSRVISEHHAGPSALELAELSELIIAADQVVALLESTPRVSNAELEEVTYLRDTHERAFVASCVLGLPAVIRDFESESGPAPRQSRAHALAAPSSLSGPHTALHVPVTCKNTRLRAVSLARDGIVMHSHVALHEEEVLPFSVESPLGPIEFFATVTLCAPEARRFRIEARPLALGELAHQRWQRLLHG